MSTTEQVNNAIIKLRSHILILEKKKVVYEKKIENYNRIAKQCLKKKDRNGAILKVKLRKQVEKRLETIENQIFNLEMQIMTLDESLMNTNMINSLKVVNNQLNTQNIQKQIDDVDKINEQLTDAIDLQQELNDILGKPLIDFDDDDLEQQLLELDDINAAAATGSNTHNNLINNNNNNNNNIVVNVSDQDNDNDDNDVDDDDKVIADIKKFEMEMLQNGNNHNKSIIDVQIVTSSTKKPSNRMVIESY